MAEEDEGIKMRFKMFTVEGVNKVCQKVLRHWFPFGRV